MSTSTSPPKRCLAPAVLAVFSVLYAVLVVAQLSEAYIDFGDGNYLYIASRLLDGTVLYRDILSPQPPIHVCVGAALLWLGGFLGSPLYTVRVFSIVLHLLTMCLVARLAWRLYASNAAAIAAAALYLLVPIGFWWALGYQSEPFEMAFLMASTLFFIDLRPRSMLIAGLLAAGGPLCNMTAVPFLMFNALYLLVCRPRLLLWYLAPIVVVCGVVAAAFEIATGAFFENVFFNQVGTFPKEEIIGKPLWRYVIDKLQWQGVKAFCIDGAWVMWGLAGLRLLSKRNDRTTRAYAVWLMVSGLLSIVFVSKGATADYIFSLGEPMLCVAGGGFWAALIASLVRWRSGRRKASSPANETAPAIDESVPADREPAPKAGLLLVAMGLIWFAGLGPIVLHPTIAPRTAEGEIRRVYPSGLETILNTLRGYQYEMGHDGVQAVKDLIERYSEPGEAIIAHPYFAYIADRTLVEEYSEVFIWNVKYLVETMVDKRPGKGVAKLEAMAEAIRERRVPIVFLDMNQTGQQPLIRDALDEHYEVVTEFRTMNTPFLVLKPRERLGEWKPAP